MDEEPLHYAKNYYAGASDSVSGLKFRVDPQVEIRRVIDTFAGITRDKYGRVTSKEYPMMNEEGVRHATGWLEGTVTKMTHLTKYVNEERLLRQARHYIKVWVYTVVRNKKRWEVKSLRTVIAEVEKLITESMFRGIDGFEANLTAKSIQVHELYKQEEAQKSGGLFGSGLFRGRKGPEGF